LYTPNNITQSLEDDLNTPDSGSRRKRNKLAGEKSPYLLQHAENPVDWYPWGKEAFERAKNEDKPIFLSIGYSTCHWCHVMEHESFEDTEVARLMNDAFVSIKVDREERPDIDKVYMSVCQIMTGSGGWPLTIIMTPDKTPFFAATFIPKETMHGRIGMVELIPRVMELWDTERERLVESAEQISTALAKYSMTPTGSSLDQTLLRRGFADLRANFDRTNGGFGSAPKFPTPHNLLFLLRYWKRTGDEQAVEMVEKTLEGMMRGGIHDHVGFGFHRYSTDSRWLVPHFEKMLYDQAMISMAYTEAYQAIGSEELGRVAKQTFEYVLRDMTSDAGGFFSAEDADSEGVEGKFYVWTMDEIASLFNEEEISLLKAAYDLDPSGNFLDESTRQRTGANILHMPRSVEVIAHSLGMEETQLSSRLQDARSKLFEKRRQRVHPLKDDKVLADWNGLMITALAKGAQVFGDTKYRDAAESAVAFVFEKMRAADGRLMHRYRDSQTSMPSHLDDYAFLAWGLIELYEATFETEHLENALFLAEIMLRDFWDRENGGFFFTSGESDELMIRTKEIYDGAIPSGNSVAMLVLLKLAGMLARPEFEARADDIGKAFYQKITDSPAAHAQLMVALDLAVGPATEVVIVGDPEAEDTAEMIQTLRKFYLPQAVVLLKPPGDAGEGLVNLAPFVEPFAAINDKATAYVCSGHACKLPTNDVAEMLTQLGVKP
jgi:hypothetical protein